MFELMVALLLPFLSGIEASLLGSLLRDRTRAMLHDPNHDHQMRRMLALGWIDSSALALELQPLRILPWQHHGPLPGRLRSGPRRSALRPGRWRLAIDTAAPRLQVDDIRLGCPGGRGTGS